MPPNSPTQSTPPTPQNGGGWWPEMVVNGWQHRMVTMTGVVSGRGCWLVAASVSDGWGFIMVPKEKRKGTKT
ncbi:hypothetical protein Pyn_05846 [Prunus yedoensis var. nudiflora]|uniref:Uncharacterized protein n=1 Tax=Prunus yedoensis var. nudiflora TaxID=2094558 RepID=A0A314UZL3_PRUYE|nr:hypothetical protein Pyn_05846 [Prunus yedoensis var. nudiflora]